MKTSKELRTEIREFLQSLNLDEDTIIHGIDLIFRAGDVNMLGENTIDGTDPAILRDAPLEMRAYIKKLPVEERKEFYWKISRNFDVRLYPKVKEFIKQIEALNEAELNEWVEEEEAKESYIEKQRMDFEVYDHDIYPGEIVIYDDCIHVTAYEYQDDFSRLIPPCGKYVENSTWSYPISRLHEFKPNKDTAMYSGMPVLYQSEQVYEYALSIFSGATNNKLTRLEVADKIRTIIYSCRLPIMVAVNVWEKYGKVRVYIEENAPKYSEKEKFGHIDITLSGANYDKLSDKVQSQIETDCEARIRWGEFQIEDIADKIPSWMPK